MSWTRGARAYSRDDCILFEDMHGKGAAIEQSHSDRDLQVQTISHKALTLLGPNASRLCCCWGCRHRCAGQLIMATKLVNLAETHSYNGHYDGGCDGPGYNPCSIPSPV